MSKIGSPDPDDHPYVEGEATLLALADVARALGLHGVELSPYVVRACVLRGLDCIEAGHRRFRPTGDAASPQ